MLVCTVKNDVRVLQPIAAHMTTKKRSSRVGKISQSDSLIHKYKKCQIRPKTHSLESDYLFVEKKKMRSVESLTGGGKGEKKRSVGMRNGGEEEVRLLMESRRRQDKVHKNVKEVIIALGAGF